MAVTVGSFGILKVPARSSRNRRSATKEKWKKMITSTNNLNSNKY